ncbi:DUF4250 domain-containing protein [Sporanaerobium hydrogeniformans]|uniref:DUF4250 domain-containing protein n=1 Tax=Sporanaerobium hydrogeniformans TaxID=3072179 RepID=A0AC61DFF6_9FIRM|nr:DUF4250 domain-containing protein [Sporanaerobium hydrogeniformans]PHV71989.1 DUF4250 domain-containing protein [Sporanaerobium hydrogeniformans]
MFNTKDPYLLLSIVNMKLRDEASSLEDLCKTYNQKQEEVEERLSKVGYKYNSTLNQFVAE